MLYILALLWANGGALRIYITFCMIPLSPPDKVRPITCLKQVIGVAANTPTGIRQALKQLSACSIQCIVIEATGRHEQALVQTAQHHNIPIVIAQPISIRRFAGVLGILAKTDQLDSQVIAHHAATIKPPVRKLPDKTTRQLKDLCVRRWQVINMITMEKNRLQVMSSFLPADIRRSIASLKRQCCKLDERIHQLSLSVAAWRKKREVMQSMPAVGTVLATTLISDLPETT